MFACGCVCVSEEGHDVCMRVCSAEVQQKAPCVYLDAVCKNVMCVDRLFIVCHRKAKGRQLCFHECLCECVCVSVSKMCYEFLNVFFFIYLKNQNTWFKQWNPQLWVYILKKMQSAVKFGPLKKKLGSKLVQESLPGCTHRGRVTSSSCKYKYTTTVELKGANRLLLGLRFFVSSSYNVYSVHHSLETLFFYIMNACNWWEETNKTKPLS